MTCDLMTEPYWVRAPRVFTPATTSTAAEAVRRGDLTPAESNALDLEAVPEAASGVGPDLAVEAARLTLGDAAVNPAGLRWLFHTWTHYQGHDLWSPAHYVAHALGLDHVVPAGLHQVCNGSALGLSIAARMVRGADEAVVTSGDRFSDDGFNRWGGDYGIAYGDGGTAALVGKQPRHGALRVLCTVHSAAPELELMHRGDDDLQTAPGKRGPVDARRTKRAYLSRFGRDSFAAVSAAHLTEVAQTVCDVAADLTGQRAPVLSLGPRLGRQAVDEIYGVPLGAITGAPHVHTSRGTGHLGAGDMIANLAALDRRRLGDSWALLVTSGAGFSWTAMAVTFAD